MSPRGHRATWRESSSAAVPPYHPVPPRLCAHPRPLPRVGETLDHIAKLRARKAGDKESAGLLSEFVSHPQGAVFIGQAVQWRTEQAQVTARRAASDAYLKTAGALEELYTSLEHPTPPDHAEDAGVALTSYFQAYWSSWSEPLEQPCGPSKTPARAALLEMLQWRRPSRTEAQPGDTEAEDGVAAAQSCLGAACGAIVEFSAHLVISFLAGPHGAPCTEALAAGQTQLSALLKASGLFQEPPVKLVQEWMRSLCAVAAGLQKYNKEKYSTATADALQLARAIV